MQVKLYVGNLDYTISEAELRVLFARAGGVDSVEMAYRLGDLAGPTTTRHTDVTLEADSMNEEPAPRAERRSPGRPWSSAAGSAQVATAAAAAVADDNEWQEF